MTGRPQRRSPGNREYRRAGIPHIIVNKSDCETARTHWQDALYNATYGYFYQGDRK